MSAPKTPAAIQLALLKAASDQLDDNEIRGHRFDSDLNELLHLAVDCIGTQIAEKSLNILRLGAARTRGDEYLKQAMKANKKYEELRKRNETPAEIES
jgi:hypothetical protein